MQVYNKKLNDILNQRSAKLIINGNQRNYSWEKKHCKQLINDVLSHSNDSEYWLGTIMTKVMPNGDFSICDGQQRITTFSLVYLAIRNLIKNTKKYQKDSELLRECDRLNEMYIIDKYSNNEIYHTQNRLILRDDDNDHYNDVVIQQIKPYNDDNITKNYYYFYDFFKKQGKETIIKYINLFEKITITHFCLEDKDNEYVIFQSINSTGKELTSGEILKNTLYNEIHHNNLLHFNTKDALKDNVMKIERNAMYDMDSLFRFWFYCKKGSWISPKNKDTFTYNIDRYIKIYNTEKGIEKLIEDLYQFSVLYYQVVNCKYEDEKINTFLQRTIKNNDIFLIWIFDILYQGKDISTEVKLQLLRLGENVLFRKWICGHAQLNHTFENIFAKALEMNGNIVSNVIDVINKLPTSSFRTLNIDIIPNDDDFINAFLHKKIYEKAIGSEWRKYIFNSLENYYNGYEPKEYIDIYNLLDNGSLTIEHIIPQTITKEWEEMLGNDKDEIYDKYIHTISNLTITGYNSEYSNKSFNEKKTMLKGFKDSPFRMNQDIATFSVFNKESLLKRAEKLKQIALKKWSIE